MNKRRRIHMLNQQKRRVKFKKKRYMLYYIFFSIILITTFLILSFTVFFNIKEIEFTGKTSHKIEDILNIGGLREGDNLILTNTKKAKQNILNYFKDIDYVEITKIFPEKIKIECVDCVPYFYCKKNNNRYIYISKNNRVFKTDTKKTPKGVFYLYVEGENFDRFKNGDFFEIDEKSKKKFEIIKDSIEREKIKNITQIKIEKDKSYIIFEDRVSLEIEEIKKTDFLLNLSKKILKNIVGPYEKGKIIYIKSKRATHFIPTKEI